MKHRRLWAAFGISGLLLLAGQAASAHAVLESTTPTQGSEVSAAPVAVSLHFGEGVGINERSLEVLNPAGARVDVGAPVHPHGDASTVAVTLKSGLPKASYAVLWHVVSADSHPVGGAFSFGVGVPAGATPADKGGSKLVGGLAGGLRTVAYSGAALLGGGLFFLLLLWPAGLALRRSQLLIRTGWVFSLVSAVGLFLLEGPYGAGLGINTAFQGPLISSTLGTNFGKLLLARVLLLAAVLPILNRLRPHPVAAVTATTRERALLTVLAVAGAATFSLGEHSGQGIQVPLAAPLDMLHVLAASVWLGGLLVLGAALLSPEHALALRDVMPRWSRVGIVSVLVLVGTGGYLTWRQVGTPPAITGTTYGKILLIKIGLFAVMLGFAEFGRRWVAAHATVREATVAVVAPVRETALVGGGTAAVSARSADLDRPGPQSAGSGRRPPGVPSRLALRQLRRSVGLEAGIGVGVLILTALLVNGVPARQAYTSPYSATVIGVDAGGDKISVTVDLDPANVGRDTVHLYTFTTKGVVLPYQSATGSMEERPRNVGPVDFTFGDTGPGHGTADGVVVPVNGVWTLTVQILTDPLTDYSATFTIPVR